MTLPALLFGAGLAGLPRSPIDVDLLACQAAREQQRIEYRWRMYEYFKEDVVEKDDGQGRPQRQSTLRYVHRSRPHGVGAGEIVERDGRRLEGDEALQEKTRFEGKLAAVDDPRALRAALVAGLKESAEKASTMAAMDEAFELRFEGLDWIEGEPCYVISFAPRDGFRPQTREQSVFQKMQGVAWVRAERPAFLRIEADFVENASIKFGPFATITRGSHFLLRQGEAEPGVTMAEALDLDLKLRILFVVKQSQRRGTYYRDFRRVNPPWRELEP